MSRLKIEMPDQAQHGAWPGGGRDGIARDLPARNKLWFRN